MISLCSINRLTTAGLQQRETPCADIAFGVQRPPVIKGFIVRRHSTVETDAAPRVCRRSNALRPATRSLPASMQIQGSARSHRGTESKIPLNSIVDARAVELVIQYVCCPDVYTHARRG